MGNSRPTSSTGADSSSLRVNVAGLASSNFGTQHEESIRWHLGPSQGTSPTAKWKPSSALRPPARYYFRASLQRPSAALGVALPHLLWRFDWLAKLILCCQYAVQKLSAPTARKNAIEACFGQGLSAKQRPPTWSTKFVTGTGLDRCALLRTDVAPSHHWGAMPALLHVTPATMAADLRPSWAESRTPYKIHTFAT